MALAGNKEVWVIDSSNLKRESRTGSICATMRFEIGLLKFHPCVMSILVSHCGSEIFGNVSINLKDQVFEESLPLLGHINLSLFTPSAEHDYEILAHDVHAAKLWTEIRTKHITMALNETRRL